MMMEDVKIYNKDMYTMYPDFRGAFNGADHIASEIPMLDNNSGKLALRHHYIRV
jgi:hypothetical protein